MRGASSPNVVPIRVPFPVALPIAILAVLGACWRGPDEPPPAAPQPPPPDTAEAARKARCKHPPAEKLASFLSVEPHATYWIDMYDDGAGWQPIEPLPVPDDHATRIELTNAAEFDHRFARGTRRARFLIEIRSRETRPGASGRLWFTTYHAHILETCVLRSRL